MGILYATLAATKQAGDVAGTQLDDARLLRALDQASRSVEGLLHRRFYPEISTRYFDWPVVGRSFSWRLWLDANELISITTLVTGCTTLDPASYFLRRADGREEAPYTLIEVNRALAGVFQPGSTPQRSIAITGLFGYRLDEAPAGTLAAAITTTSATTITVTDSSVARIGALLRCGTERLNVTGAASVTTGQTITGNLAALASASSWSVADGTQLHAGEIVTIGAERMLITDVTGNLATVERAYDGTVLAAHTTGDTVYAPRLLTVERGSVGTTAATALNGATLVRQVYPGPVEALTVAYAVNQSRQESSGYARTAGTGEAASEFTGRGIAALEADARASVGRQGRTAAV